MGHLEILTLDRVNNTIRITCDQVHYSRRSQILVTTHFFLNHIQYYQKKLNTFMKADTRFIRLHHWVYNIKTIVLSGIIKH